MSHDQYATGLTRREMLRRLLLGGAGLALGGGLAPVLWANGEPFGRTRPGGRAKAVIQIWLWGGPCHLDTFDPKPSAGHDYCGPLAKATATNADGVQLNAALPRLAKQADKFSLIRSMTHGVFAHETASYIVQTGHTPGSDRLVYPSVGAAVSAFRGYDHGYQKRISPYVILTKPIGRFSEVGFLDLKHRPFVTGGDPNQRRFAVEGIVTQGVSDERQRRRRKLLHDLDTLGKALPKSEDLAELDRCEASAYELILGDAGKVFDVTQEPEAMRERYGRNKLGQSCLAARRLVEYGVPYVSINSEGWDTHKRHFQIMGQKLPQLDRALAALLQDLSERGLLDSTIIWCSGEFGRSPRVQWGEPWNGGRGHYGRCFSTLVAGGGFRGGHVVGSTDAKGEEVTDRPVHPRELISTIYTLLGIDPKARMPNSRGLDVPVLPPAPKASGGSGLLTEII